jgi:hypothetical protein
MREITISDHHGVRHRHTMAAAFWIVVGIVAVVAVGDTLALLALVLAIFATAWWICREVEHRVTSNDAWRYVTASVPEQATDENPGSARRPRRRPNLAA